MIATQMKDGRCQREVVIELGRLERDGDRMLTIRAFQVVRRKMELLLLEAIAHRAEHSEFVEYGDLRDKSQEDPME